MQLSLWVRAVNYPDIQKSRYPTRNATVTGTSYWQVYRYRITTISSSKLRSDSLQNPIIHTEHKMVGSWKAKVTGVRSLVGKVKDPLFLEKYLFKTSIEPKCIPNLCAIVVLGYRNPDNYPNSWYSDSIKIWYLTTALLWVK